MRTPYSPALRRPTSPAGAAPTQAAAPATLLDVDGAAARLGTPVRFIRRLVAQRRIRFYKVGRYVRFDPADLDHWLTSNAREALR